ncbi:MAG TPA: MBL fold metallo-hydrolase [Candidatus Limiplasma sp.]|nr:MBL fold metallo-hydrolase [Candidatus Limiplasma sp.]HRX08697.1 MBL fold metallo-hydrolase [Candidatus Limiplasma sp.]
MLRRLLIPVFLLLIPAIALASPVVYHRPGARLAPYEPVAVAQPDMLFETAELLTVNFLDRGAADCILLRIDGQTMLVDGASLNQFGFIRDELAALDVRHFNYMVNTHAHRDHIDGLLAILKRDDYLVDAYLSCYTDDYPGSEDYTRVRELLAQKDIPYYRIGDGDHFMLGQAAVAVFRDETPGIDKNRHSLVLKVVFGDRSVLLMGDAGGETQEYLLNHYGAPAFKADVLKFAHHGMTPMLSAFLTAVSPELVVVTNMRSAVPRTEHQLAALHIPRYYTHTGMIEMETDGQFWIVEQMPRD